MRIGIAIPLTKHLEGEFFRNFIDVLNEVIDKHEVEVITRVGDSLDRNRNELVKTAILKECDYVWFIDSDQIIPKGTLDRLLSLIQEKKVGIVSGMYFTRMPPNLPVIRKRVGELFEAIFDYKGITEVDGIGFGCCLADISIFKEVNFPWFEFKYEEVSGFPHYFSEDLTFCKKLRNKGIKILVDTDLVISHIGGIVDDSDYSRIKNTYIKADKIKNELIEDLSEFDNISEENVRMNIIHGQEKYKEEWKSKNPKTKEERDKLYKESYWSKYDLAGWHIGSRMEFDQKLVEMIKAKYPDRNTPILDYGCGIAHNSFLLAKEGYTNIALYDLNMAFAKYRFNRHNLPFKDFMQDKFKVILCFDMLEHLDDKDFDETISLFKKLIEPDGEFLLTVSFGNEGNHPMHFNGSEEKIKKVKELMKND